MTYLFESMSYGLEKLEDGSIRIHCKLTNEKALFAPYAAMGLINNIYQQADMGKEYSDSLERLGNLLYEKGSFF